MWKQVAEALARLVEVKYAEGRAPTAVAAALRLASVLKAIWDLKAEQLAKPTGRRYRHRHV